MGAGLILEKLLSMPSFYDIVCFSILASRTHLNATLKNIFRSYSNDAIIFNCEPYIMDVSLVLEDFFRSSKILPII